VQVAGTRDFGAIIDAARGGEDWAVRLLFEDLQPRLLRYLSSRARHAADDIAGEVWEAIARGISTFEGDESGFRAWAFTIARRRVIEHQRRSTRRKTDPIDDAHLAEFAAPVLVDMEAIDRMSAREAVALITSVLPHEQAEVVLLRVVAGLDTALVSEILGRSETWVRVTQHRALHRLADRVGTKIGVTEDSSNAI
jgi:RNA polymerase sigma-70 factor (ECF subfamily)